MNVSILIHIFYDYILNPPPFYDYFLNDAYLNPSDFFFPKSLCIFALLGLSNFQAIESKAVSKGHKIWQFRECANFNGSNPQSKLHLRNQIIFHIHRNWMIMTESGTLLINF